MADEAVVTETPAALPSLQEVAAKLTGGTSSDPNIPAQGEKVAEPAAKEEPKAEVKEPAKALDKTASRFAALTRKEKEVRAVAADTDRRAKELEAREKALQDRDSSWKRIKDDPISALKEAGFTYADLTAAMMGQYKKPEEDPLDTRFRPVTDKLTATEETITKLQKEIEDLRNQNSSKEQQEQYNTVMSNIKAAATSDPVKYELINKMEDEGTDLVRDTMIEYFKQHQEMLDYSRACDMVEKYYEDELLGRVSGTAKLKARMGISDAPKAPATAPQATTEKKLKEPAATLTNKMATASQANVDIDKLPKKEALAALLQRYKS